MKDENDNEIVNISNENILFSNSNNNNIKKPKKSNFGELTKEQIELIKKIREETLSRTERYSEIINDSNSNNILFNIIDNNKKKKKINLKKKDNKTDNIKIILDNSQKDNINPNKEKIYNLSQPFLYIKGEPYIFLGPDTIYYVWIFSFVSFLSIIIYSLKNSSIFFKILFIFGYLFFSITYTLLLLINPGIPKNKKKLELAMPQKQYAQCHECNCISLKEKGAITFHCEKCKICIEHFDHHCTFATKCIGKGNNLIFKLCLFSIGCFFVIIFLYLIF